MDNVNDIVGTSLGAIFQLRRLGSGTTSRPEQLHRHMRGFIDDLMKRAGAAGFDQADTQDMAYAVVAMADEAALGLSDAVREYWMAHLLQFQYFKENQAGEGFFDRLKQVRGDPNRQSVLMVYYLVLSLGFQGKHGVRGGELELMALQEDLAKELGRSLPRGFEEDVLSEHAERPPEASVAGSQSKLVMVLAAGGVALAIVLFIVLRVTLSMEVRDVAKIAASSPKKAPAAAPRPEEP
jgi:type VI secretion system protein ImpK